MERRTLGTISSDCTAAPVWLEERREGVLTDFAQHHRIEKSPARGSH